MKSKLLVCSFCLTIIALAAGSVQAQNSEDAAPGNELAIGAHFGLPTGLSMKLETEQHSYDLLMAWNLNDFFVAQSHVWLMEKQLTQQPRLAYYAGPGLVLQGDDGTLQTGFSATAGLTFDYAPFEFFLQVSPLLNVVPSTEGDVNAGAGFRIFL